MSLRPSDEYTIVGNTESEHCVCGQESATAYFRLRFAELGEIPIKVGVSIHQIKPLLLLLLLEVLLLIEILDVKPEIMG